MTVNAAGWPKRPTRMPPPETRELTVPVINIRLLAGCNNATGFEESPHTIPTTTRDSCTPLLILIQPQASPTVTTGWDARPALLGTSSLTHFLITWPVNC